jgi:hypothetical protein
MQNEAEEEEFITQDDVQEQYELNEGDGGEQGIEEGDMEDDMEDDMDNEERQLTFEDDSIQGFFDHRGTYE